MKGVLVEMICNHRVRVGILASFLLAVILPSVTVCQPAAISPAAISPTAISPTAISPTAISPTAISPAAIRKFLQWLGRWTKRIPDIPSRPKRPKRPGPPRRPIPLPPRLRVEQSLIKTQRASRAAKSAIDSIPNGVPHAARILMKVWQANQEKIDAVVEKMKSSELSDRKLDKLERELEDVRKDQQNIEELTQKYG